MNSNIPLDEYLDFQKYWLVLKRRWIPATAVFVTIVGSSLAYSLSLDKIYEAEAQLLIKVDRTPKLTGLDDSSGEIEGLTADSDPLTTEAQLVSSRPLVNQIIKELDLRNDNGKLIDYKGIQDSLKATPIMGTDLLEVTYTDTDPEFAALVVNKAIELYQKDHTLNNRSETASARAFIDRQLPEVEATVKEAEANLRNFKNRNRIANLEQETTANINSLSTIADRIDEVEAELEGINARYSRLNNQLNMTWQEASAVSPLSQSMAVQRVLEQLQEVKVGLAQKQNYLSDNAPQIITLKEEETKLNALLDQQIASTLGSEQQRLIERVNILSLGELKQDQIAEFAELGLQKEGLDRELATLRNTYNSYKQKSDTLPALEEQQRELERRLEAAQSTYQTLLSKLQETRISEQQNVGNVRVVNDAVVPEEEIGPSKKVIVAGGGIVGGFLAVATAFLLDIRDRTVKNVREIKTMLPYPFAGIVPDLNRLDKQLLLPERSTDLPEIAANNISVPCIREAYHNIQLNLELLDEETANKVIVVTSSSSAEGKSSVSANLAVAQAQCGKKVLLIDADLRRPTQHKLWNIPNEIGLADVLQQDTVWFDNLHHVIPNLDLMTSGTVAKNPISLLNSLLMRELLTSSSSYYDCIIIDTPPLVGLADSKILSKLADGLLFVVRPKVANYGSVVAASEILAHKDFNVLGVVANSVNIDKDSYEYGYYYADRKYLSSAS